MGSDWLVVICCKSFSEFEKVTKKTHQIEAADAKQIGNAIIDAKCDRKEKTTWILLIWQQKKSTKIYMQLVSMQHQTKTTPKEIEREREREKEREREEREVH